MENINQAANNKPSARGQSEDTYSEIEAPKEADNQNSSNNSASEVLPGAKIL